MFTLLLLLCAMFGAGDFAKLFCGNLFTIWSWTSAPFQASGGFAAIDGSTPDFLVTNDWLGDCLTMWLILLQSTLFLEIGLSSMNFW